MSSINTLPAQGKEIYYTRRMAYPLHIVASTNTVQYVSKWNAHMLADLTCQDPDKGGNGEKVVFKETQQEAPGLWL